MESGPLKALEASGHAILVTDVDGTLRMCTRLAADLLECDPGSAVGQRCWTAVRLQSPDGSAFCCPDCAIRRRAREQGSPWCQTARVRVPTSPRLDIELLTFSVLQKSGILQPILHFLTPFPMNRETGEPAERSQQFVIRPNGLARLSRREMEVLRLLALGLGTLDIAISLFISPVTVRNHVESILRKLGVHSRLDAILMWLGGTRTRAGTATMPIAGTAHHDNREE